MPTRAYGLIYNEVVPYVGTWIEIVTLVSSLYLIEVVPYVGTWIEIRTCSAVWRREVRRSLRGNVDRNQLLANGSENGAYSRSLRGNVDRNDTEAEALEYLE